MNIVAKMLPIALVVASSGAFAETLPMSWAPPSGMPPGPIEESKAVLVRAPEGASMMIETSGLTPGHAMTVWFVAMQSPENCDKNPCSPMDAMSKADAMNTVATNAGGAIVDEGGRNRVSGFLPVGVVAGNFYDTTFTEPQSSEYHIVIHDHGPLILELAADMLSSFRGGCTAESVPPFYPDASRVDGEGGPNSCVTRQVALFVAPKMAN